MYNKIKEYHNIIYLKYILLHYMNKHSTQRKLLLTICGSKIKTITFSIKVYRNRTIVRFLNCL